MVIHRSLEGGLAVVAGIGSAAWDRLFTGARPAELHPFQALDGDPHVAVSTPGDLLFHIRAESLDVCFELADRILRSMAGAVTVVGGRTGSLRSTRSASATSPPKPQ